MGKNSSNTLYVEPKKVLKFQSDITIYISGMFSLHRSLAIDHPAVGAPDGLEQDELLDDTTDVFTPIVPEEDDVDEI